MPVDNRVGHEIRKSGTFKGIIAEDKTSKPDSKTFVEYAAPTKEQPDASQNPASASPAGIYSSPHKNHNIDISLEDHHQNSDNMSDNKLTYKMISPGEAWMNHVNNDMNAKAVTPAWLEPKAQQEKGSGLEMIEQINKEAEAIKNNSPAMQPDTPDTSKDIEPSR